LSVVACTFVLNASRLADRLLREETALDSEALTWLMALLMVDVRLLATEASPAVRAFLSVAISAACFAFCVLSELVREAS